MGAKNSSSFEIDMRIGKIITIRSEYPAFIRLYSVFIGSRIDNKAVLEEAKNYNFPI